MAKPQRKITLFLNDKEETFYSKFASARNVFKAQDLMLKMESFENSEDNKMTEQEVFEEVLDFCGIFCACFPQACSQPVVFESCCSRRGQR